MRRFRDIILAVALSIATAAAGLADPTPPDGVPTEDGMRVFALQWFAQMQAGKIDRTQYTAAYGAQLTDDAVQAMSHHLNEYGAAPNRGRCGKPSTLIILQSENDHATGTYSPIGTGLFNLVNLRFHWDQVPVPGGSGQQLPEGEFYTQTPSNNKYLVNFHVVPLGDATPPPGLKAADDRAFEANIRQNLLSAAGFRTVIANTPQNNGHVA